MVFPFSTRSWNLGHDLDKNSGNISETDSGFFSSTCCKMNKRNLLMFNRHYQRIKRCQPSCLQHSNLMTLYQYWRQLVRPNSELLHQILPNCPHPCPLPIYIHWYREKHTSKLNTAKCKKGFLGSARLQPMWEEQREYKTVQNVCLYVRNAERYDMLVHARTYFWKHSMSPMPRLHRHDTNRPRK
jgi:hypothetical protein